MFLTISAIIITICTSVYLFLKWSLNYWQRRGVPTLPVDFPYGHVKGVNKTQNIKDVLDKPYQAFKGKFPLAGVYFAISPVAVVLDLDLAKNILIKDFNYFIDRPIYCNEEIDPLSAHMFSIKGTKWRILRTKLTSTFSSGKMKFMFPTVIEVADKLRDVLLAGISKFEPVFDIKDLLSRFTTDVIGRCAFGIECSSLDDPNTEFIRMGQKTFVNPRHSMLVEALIWQNPRLSKMLGMKVICDDVTEFFMGIVRETIHLRETSKVRRNDFMDLLLDVKNSEEKLTFEEIVAQAFVFFLAGYETSSTNLTFASYELALNEDVQEKARAEILTVLERHDRKLTYEAMKEMPYVDQVISETLRMYPPLSSLFRIADKDYHVPDTNFVIEKGTSVFIPVYSIQHDPEYYPNPEVFDPNRFEPDKMKTRNPMTFLSFGDGPRNCIALRFGRMQSRIGLITLLKNFKIKTCSQTQIPLKFSNSRGILSAEGKVYIQLEKI